MSGSTGKGQLYRVRRFPTLRGRVGLPDVEAPARVIANDTFWGGHAPPPTEIPYSWLTPPARWRPDPPRNVAEITRTDGAIARRRDDTSIAAVGERAYAASLDTQVVDDPDSLATWMVANYTNPRQRMPSLTIHLLSRTLTECWRILEREIGDAIHITDVPAAWPDGVDHLVIEGITHHVHTDERSVEWSTAPLIGAAPGEAGPWFRADESLTDTGSDLLAF